MDPVRYRILGTTQALRPDGTAVPVGGARLRALLTVLALRPGRTVPVRVLVEEVWDGDPPADATGALQALVGRLRRALGAHAVASAEGGYRLAAAADDIDLHRFERLAGEGLRALADGDPAKAAAVLDDALALWRGPALADLPDRTAEAARWETRHRDVRRARLAAALALGHAAQVLPDLTALCDTHPLDEPLQALRLRALRDAGRPAEALAAYEDVRHLLADRLGSDPGPELRALHEELLRPSPPGGRGPGAGAAGHARGDAARRTEPTAADAAPSRKVPAPTDARGPRAHAADATPGPGGTHGLPADGAYRRRAAGSYGPGAEGAPGRGPEGVRGAGADGRYGSAAGAYGPPAAGATPGPGADAPPGPRAGGAPGAGADEAFGPSAEEAYGPGTDTDRAPGPRAAGASGLRAPGTPGPPAGRAPGPHAAGAPGALAAGAYGSRADEACGADAVEEPGVRAVLPGAAAGAHAPPAGGQARTPAEGGREPASGAAGTASLRPSSNIRVRLTSFVGREDDIAAIRADLGDARLVTLLGPGGAGKTRLSQEAAEAVRPVPRDGVWLAELAPVDDPAAVPEAVLTAVGARETVLYGAGAEEMRVAVADRHDEPVERLVEHCSRRRMLLLLDNCEHVVDAAARLVEELLARCPHLTVLATSREPLGVPGELVRPVEPLPDPVALRLFAERGAAVRPGFRVDADENTAAACAEICRRLDGLPLAIELAAARLRMLTPAQIAGRLDDRFRLLTSGSRTVLPRQQTLRAVVDWSWDLLDEDERYVLGRLSVFAGGCGLAAAEAVCGPAAFDALGSLVDKSLVVAAPAPDGEMRYRLLETVAEYAGERLDETGGRAEAERAHLTYYRELARTTDVLLRGPGQATAIARFELEYENLRTALRHAVAEKDEQEALCLVLSLVWYWQMRDLRIEARNLCSEVMALGPDPFAEPVRRAEPVWQRCTDVPPPLSGELLAEARRGLHLAHLACMDTELDAWQTPESQAKLRVITQVYEPGMPQTCRPPGLLWFFAVLLTEGMDRMRAIIDACVETSRRTPGFEWELAGTLQMRANILANRIEWAGDATRDADEALEIFERLGDDWGAAEALSARGESYERKGEYEAAATDFRSAIEHAERLGAHAQAAVLGVRLGAVLLETGEPERGERMLRDTLAQENGTAHEAMPMARLFLAGWLSLTDRVSEAREQLRLLRQEFGISHFVVFDAFILGQEAWVDSVDGRPEEALVKIRQALGRAADPLSQTIAPHMRPLYLVIAATALAALDGGGRAGDAARCLGAAESMLPAGHVAGTIERAVRERAEAAVRAVLDDEAFEAAYAQGGGLSPGEATALV
ncbi:BTAD domain-containing putative transcriptional regulator [Streptomyces anandii]|uniref:AfsR/SARP family transcriptional regulator n=1 Tax=Streptomyces anandii TaxID=285454 RepID=UPI0037028CE2